MSDPDHPLHRAFEIVKDEVAGACRACATSFRVREMVQASGVPLLAEYKGHQSIRERVAQGYQVITFYLGERSTNGADASNLFLPSPPLAA